MHDVSGGESESWVMRQRWEVGKVVEMFFEVKEKL